MLDDHVEEMSLRLIEADSSSILTLRSSAGIRHQSLRQRADVQQLHGFERQPPGRPLRGHGHGRRAGKRDRQSRKHFLRPCSHSRKRLRRNLCLQVCHLSIVVFCYLVSKKAILFYS